MEQPEYIMGAAAAKMLGMSKPTLIKEATEGYINAHKRRGRYLFTRADVLEYTQRNTTSHKYADWALKLQDGCLSGAINGYVSFCVLGNTRGQSR